MALETALKFTPKGIYCPAGDFYIDPWRPVARALITHGHADHARPGMGSYLATHLALPVIRHRLGDIRAEGINYGEIRTIGGAKVSTKLDLLENLVEKVDHLVIGGGMANTFLAAQGIDVGKSLAEHEMTGTALEILAKAEKAGCEIVLPADVVIAREFAANAPHETVAAHACPADAMILDDMFQRVTGWKPRMWGPTIIGYGSYDYTYETGYSGTSLATGFSPRKANMVMYIMPGYLDMTTMLERVGKHKTGKSCLYLGRLSKVDLTVLRRLIRAGVDDLGKTWPVHPT